MIKLKDRNEVVEDFYNEYGNEPVYEYEEPNINEKEEKEIKLDPVTSLKIKSSYLFAYSLKTMFNALNSFLKTIFIYVIFAVNAFFFYEFSRVNTLSFTSCVTFFIMSMIFIEVYNRKDKKK